LLRKKDGRYSSVGLDITHKGAVWMPYSIEAIQSAAVSSSGFLWKTRADLTVPSAAIRFDARLGERCKTSYSVYSTTRYRLI
jgi:hypothetical protein